jgi:hypothetical protein
MRVQDLISEMLAYGRREAAAIRGGSHARRVASVAILALVVIVAALARSSVGGSVASSIGIATESQPFTALSFVDPSTVGVSGITGVGTQVSDRLDFRIADHEHRDRSYRWTVSLVPAGTTYHGTVSLKSGQTATVTRRVAVPCALHGAPQRVQVRVSLADPAETIDYWQSCGV